MFPVTTRANFSRRIRIPSTSFAGCFALIAITAAVALDSRTGRDEWAGELAYSLSLGSGAPALLSLTSCGDHGRQAEVVGTARAAVAAAGWPIYECAAGDLVDRNFRLEEAGYLVLRGVDVPLPVEVPVLVGPFQHMVTRGLPVGLLVAGTPAGIRALRMHPAMGFLSRAEAVDA